MKTFSSQVHPAGPMGGVAGRLDYLDATRAFALLLGVVFHACLSFMPVFMGWAVQDVSTSSLVTMFSTVSHSFRMELFFLLAGFFGRLTCHRVGVGSFLRGRAIRLGVPFVVGWFLLRPLVVSGWIMGSASLRGEVDIVAGLLGGLKSLSSLPAGIFTGSHLWFLYYLALITVMAVAGRGLLCAAGSVGDSVVRWIRARIEWLAGSPAAPVFLAIPTAAILGCMQSWGVDTPDRSLWPHVAATVIYGGFFLLGWVLNQRPELIAGFCRLDAHRWFLATAGMATILLLGGIERDPGHRFHTAAHVGYALGYAVCMWSLVFLTLGLFRRYGHRPNAFVRYVADASYWMYLVHLPLVIWMQVAVAELPVHWSLKLLSITSATVLLSLLSYDVFVRSTALGALLNGRRRERVVVPWVLGGVRQLVGRCRSRPVGEW